MQITFHSHAEDPPAFRQEVIQVLEHRLKLARIDQMNARTVREGARHTGRVQELVGLIDFYRDLRLVGDKH